MTEPVPPAIDESTLPPQMRQLVRAIGVVDTIKLLKARGGTFLKPPHSADRTYLVELVGKDSTRALINLYEGQPFVMLPKADKLLAQIRDRQIREQRAAGESLMTLALRFDLTVRMIQYICCEESEPKTVPDRQLGLPLLP